MDIFALWREQEAQSTMQALQSENARLRRSAYTSRLVALAVWIIVAWIAAYQLGVKITGGV
ncbi:MAG: hypothetical protein NUV75_02095 [Gallionella sp.]|nr:hypothetical protein [Gallionella sp.]